MVRALTTAEARVIAAMLSASTAGERERLRQLDVPRSTYHAARRRAYAEGWLRDRYIPDPSRFGWSAVRFCLARPFADSAEQLIDTWSAEPSSVVVWGSAQVVFGAFFHTDQSAAQTVEAAWAKQLRTAWALSLIIDPSTESVPVYFDFEGCWAHLCRAAGSLRYPQGLGGRGPVRRDGDAVIAQGPDLRRSWAAAELLQRPFHVDPTGRAPHRVGPFGLPWSQQRLLSGGLVTHAVLLDPSRIPPFEGRTAGQVIWITGRFRRGETPEGLFARLTRDCRVFPFVFAAQDGTALLGTLGQGAPDGAPSDARSEEPRRPVLATLMESLEGIELLQESVSAMRYAVDHRYDRLLPRRS